MRTLDQGNQHSLTIKDGTETLVSGLNSLVALDSHLVSAASIGRNAAVGRRRGRRLDRRRPLRRRVRRRRAVVHERDAESVVVPGIRIEREIQVAAPADVVVPAPPDFRGIQDVLRVVHGHHHSGGRVIDVRHAAVVGRVV